MADPISVLSSVISIASLGFQIFDGIRKFNQFLQQPAEARLRTHYGVFPTLMVKILMPDVFQRVQLVEDRIFPGDDEVVIAFRNSYISDCNMTAVAGAIIAQVAITALSLPFLSETHWVARAFWIASLISGSLSVYFACLLQRTVGVLYRAEDVRDWLTRPDEETLKMLESVEGIKKLQQAAQPAGAQTYDLPEHQKDLSSIPDMEQARQQIPRFASLFSALVMSAPSSMINIALGSFLLGLGVYLGFLWTRHLDTQGGRNDSRDVFIIFIVSTVIIIALYATPAAYKRLEMSAMENVNRGRVERSRPRIGEPNERKEQSQETVIQSLIDTLRQTNRAQEASIRVSEQLTAEITKLTSGYGSEAPRSPHEQAYKEGTLTLVENAYARQKQPKLS